MSCSRGFGGFAVLVRLLVPALVFVVAKAGFLTPHPASVSAVTLAAWPRASARRFRVLLLPEWSEWLGTSRRVTSENQINQGFF